jgi:hypothetical protein
LPLQIRDLLFAFGNLFFALGYSTAQFLVLSLQPLIFTL